jgi:hypothetical protein
MSRPSMLEHSDYVEVRLVSGALFERRPSSTASAGATAALNLAATGAACGRAGPYQNAAYATSVPHIYAGDVIGSPARGDVDEQADLASTPSTFGGYGSRRPP